MENIDQDKISNIEKQYQQYVSDVDNMIATGTVLVDHLVEMLRSWLNEDATTPAMKIKINNYHDSIKNIKDDGTLDNIYKPVYKQSIVLLVSGFEVSMTNLFSLLVNEYPDAIHWDKQPDNKTFGIDINLIRYYNNIGDIISRSNHNINFQDLQSTKRFLKDWLDIDIDTSSIQGDIIFAEAERNTIIHNGAVVDPNFLKQVHNTQYSKAYKVNEHLDIDEKNYNSDNHFNFNINFFCR